MIVGFFNSSMAEARCFLDTHADPQLFAQVAIFSHTIPMYRRLRVDQLFVRVGESESRKRRS